jgi:hypothetical protein
MTTSRKLTIAAVALVVLIAAIAALLLTTTAEHNVGPPAAVSFLRYDDGGQTLVLQITNLGHFTVFYVCWASYSLDPGRTNRASVLGDTAVGVEAHQALQLRIPMKILANSDVRPSSIKVHYWLRDNPLRACIRRFLRSVSATAEPQRFETVFDLQKPAQPE